MKLIDYSKTDHLKFEPKNPIVFQGSKTKYYEIEYDAVYEDGHVEKRLVLVLIIMIILRNILGIILRLTMEKKE